MAETSSCLSGKLMNAATDLTVTKMSRKMFLIVVITAVFLGSTEADLTANCSTLAENEVVISYVGDDFSVNVICEDETMIDLKVNKTITMKYTADTADDCVIPKANLDIAAYKASIYTKRYAHIETSEDATIEVTCMFGFTSPTSSTTFEFQNETTAAATTVTRVTKVSSPVLSNDGPLSESTFNVEVRDEYGNPLTITPVPFVTKVTLHVTMTPGGEDVGFFVPFCEATTNDKSIKVPLVIDGCGQTFPFPTDQGFVTTAEKPHEAISPVFKLFRLTKYGGLKFSCSFTTCKTDCSGNSCKA